MSNPNQLSMACSIIDIRVSADNPKTTSVRAIEALGKFFISPNLLSKQIALEALEAHYRASVALA